MKWLVIVACVSMRAWRGTAGHSEVFLFIGLYLVRYPMIEVLHEWHFNDGRLIECQLFTLSSKTVKRSIKGHDMCFQNTYAPTKDF